MPIDMQTKNAKPKAKKTTRVRKRAAPQENIYTSQTGATIRTSQMINEVLCRFKADYIGVDTGNKPWEHPLLKTFYQNQWPDIRACWYYWIFGANCSKTVYF